MFSMSTGGIDRPQLDPEGRFRARAWQVTESRLGCRDRYPAQR
jgi:hypothetical protein